MPVSKMEDRINTICNNLKEAIDGIKNISQLSPEATNHSRLWYSQLLLGTVQRELAFLIRKTRPKLEVQFYHSLKSKIEE